MTIMERLIAAETKAEKAHVVSLQSQAIIQEQREYIKKLQKDLWGIQQEAGELLEQVKLRTSMSVDVAGSRHNPSKIILSGTYRGQPHVNIVTCNDANFERLVVQMRDLAKYATLENIDAPRDMRDAISREIPSYRQPANLIAGHHHTYRK